MARATDECKNFTVGAKMARHKLNTFNCLSCKQKKASLTLAFSLFSLDGDI
ncbi:hypothetical protein JCM19236_1146 [Vibrio sp. JCM 19236]|nr:hypothetical protein JCM19236_1146 [Vibrio sp. JCM 19236]